MFSVLRFLFGWKDFESTRQNSIGVFVHTSYWDAFIFWLYSHDACAIAITKPQFFTWYLRPFLKLLGFISAPRLEDRGSGGISYIVKQIKDSPAYKENRPLTVAISPKGTIYKKPWRSGYRIIAKELQWPIRPVLLNYKNRSLEILDPIDPDDQSCEEKVLKALEASVPFNYENCEIACEKNTNLFVIDYVMLSNASMIPSLIKGLLISHYGSFVFGILSVTSSFMYHRSVETKWAFLDTFFARLVIVWFLYWYALGSSLLCRAAFVGSLYCFFKAAGRQNFSCRTSTYSFWHSLFHCLVGLASYTSMIK